MPTPPKTQRGCSCLSRGCLPWILGSFLSLGLLYWGYCWGWWGRYNLILQSLFQCHCPPVSETVRYAPFKLLVSACHPRTYSRMSPSGRYLLGRSKQPPYNLYRLDLLTGQEEMLGPLADTNRRVYFLRENLIMIRYPGFRTFLLDLTTRQQVPIRSRSLDVTDTRSPYPLLHQAEHVLVEYDTVVALAPNYQQHPEQNIYYHADWDERLPQFLETIGVEYELMPTPYAPDSEYYHVIAPSRRFWAEMEGIYLANGERIVTTNFPRNPDGWERFYVKGWLPGETGVVYDGVTSYIIRDRGYYSYKFFPVPQPILLVEVPPAYRASGAP